MLAQFQAQVVKSGEVVVDSTIVTDDQISSVEFENLTVDYV